MANRRAILISAIMTLLVLSSCNNTGLTPLIDPRDYVWTLDTLDTPMNLICSIWGSSPTDVWAAGPGGTIYDYLWHYDGKRWIPWYATYHGEKGLAYCTGEALFGFSANNVWMGGQSLGDPGAGLCHWDGTRWGRYFNYNPQPDTFGLVSIRQIWGRRPNDIYAVGLMLYWSKLARDGTSRGFILHYDGSTWREILRTDSGYQYHFLELTGSQNNVYVTEYQENTENRDSSLVTLYELSGNRLIKLYSNTLGDGLVSVAVIDDKLYLCVGVHNAKVYLHSGGKFIEQFSVNDLGFLVGRNEKDIFLAMSDGVAHFNGADIRYLYRFPRKYLVSNSAVFEREVFFCIYDGATGTNMILHGRLRQ